MATGPAPELAAAPTSIATPAAEALAVTTPEETFEERSYFSTYQPVYAVLGLSPANAKLQFSFKYALVDPDGDAAMRWSFLRGVYFGYTQTMFWDLAQESSPFRSIDFKPELFYRYRSDRFLQSLERPALNVQAGIRHQSNGREEPASRSFNETYIEPSVTLPVGGGYHLTAAPRAWFYFGDLEDNPDIDEFRGNTSFRLSLLREDGARLEARAIGFVGTGRGSLQTDASYPITGGFIGNLNLRAHAQLFTGYGDNLLEYDRKVTRLRIGISLAD
nr:phospholipase A [Pacificimonas flava]